MPNYFILASPRGHIWDNTAINCYLHGNLFINSNLQLSSIPYISQPSEASKRLAVSNISVAPRNSELLIHPGTHVKRPGLEVEGLTFSYPPCAALVPDGMAPARRSIAAILVVFLREPSRVHSLPPPPYPLDLSPCADYPCFARSSVPRELLDARW